MFCVYINIRTYGSSDNHSGLINTVSASTDIFLSIVSWSKAVFHESFCWILMYVERVAKYATAKMYTTIHIHLSVFIGYSILNIGFLIDSCKTLIILRLFVFRPYEINTLSNLMRYFKT